MEFKFSDVLPRTENSTGGLAGEIAVRRSRYGRREDVGAVKAQKDWNNFIGPLRNFQGGMSHKYGLIQVAVPECIPERLETIAYASEIGFLYDDCTELMDQEQVSILSGFRLVAPTSDRAISS